MPHLLQLDYKVKTGKKQFFQAAFAQNSGEAGVLACLAWAYGCWDWDDLARFLSLRQLEAQLAPFFPQGDRNG